MAAEDIGILIPTKIPGYVDTADIQAALRLYHYGSYDFDPNETDATELINPSIAYTLNDLQDQIDTIVEAAGIQESVFTAKGSLISSTGSGAVAELLAGASNGMVLTINNATSTGLQWATPTVTPSNSVTLTNKTLAYDSNTLTGVASEILSLAGAL